jgi:hypothetical protein
LAGLNLYKLPRPFVIFPYRCRDSGNGGDNHGSCQVIGLGHGIFHRFQVGFALAFFDGFVEFFEGNR